MFIRLLHVLLLCILAASCGKDDKKSEYTEEKSRDTLVQSTEIKRSSDSSSAQDKPNTNPSDNSKQNSERNSERFDDEKPVAVITPLEAAGYNGKTVTVKGFVADIYKNEKVAYLNFVEKYPDNPFTGVIFARVFDDFPEITKYKNKNVELTGRVSVYKGKPQIIINKPSQLKVN